ncbi:hypothetical protein IH601_11555 [Candidatus Bipolaricaulota bacterium]|nr:hypothetical protein [Candidatus Bipolaricaulota bacterium]
MRTAFVVAVLLCILGCSLLARAADVANTPVYILDVAYDAERRTIEGSFDLALNPSSPTIYFSLLANLGAQANPFEGARGQDAVYPFGFEPARITVLSVEKITDARTEALSFRLLAMPPSWQTYSLDDTVLAVDLSEWQADSSITLRCQFQTDAPRITTGDQGVTDGILTWRFGWFPMLFPEQTLIVEHDGVIGYEGQSSLPLVFPWTQVSGSFTIPADFQLIVGTDVVEHATTADDAATISQDTDEQATATRSYTVSNDSPSRSLAITIGSEYETYRLPGATDIAVYFLPHHEPDARFIATLALDILANYVERYGPYPRASLTIVESPSPFGQAFAADGIVWLSSRFFTHRDVLFPGALNRVMEYVLAHEIAHQWVGLATGIDLDAEAWLSEGLAQYLSVKYFEDRYGSFVPNLFAPQIPGIVGNIVEQQWGFFNLREHLVELPYLLSTRAGFDEELVKPTQNVQYGNAESVRLYDKGYLVARALSAKIGEDTFARALVRAIKEKQADLLDARSLQHLLEEESGQPLDAFFDFWVFGPGSADYSIRILDRAVEDDIHTTRVVVTRDGGVAQPVMIEATMQSEGVARQEWDGVEESAVMTFTTPTWVSNVTIDPQHWIPDRDRLNNHAPAKIVGAVNKNVLPLDAYVLAPDQATGGLIFTHLDRLRIQLSQSSASAAIKLERNHQVSIDTSFSVGQVTGTIAYTFTAYAQPETGSPATYWEPDVALSISAERFIDANEPFVALAFQATDLPSMASSATQSVMLRVAPHGVRQAELEARNEARLLPGVYLQGSVRVGLSSGIVPQPLAFHVSEIRSIPLPSFNHIASAKVALELPSIDALPYSLLHLAMIDRVSSRVFITAGAGWTRLDEFGTTSPSIEAGMEQIIELSTLGGLISLTAQVGIATPILGEGTAVLYGGISF